MYAHHNGGQVHRREAADILVIVDIQDLLANVILGPDWIPGVPGVKLDHSCTAKIRLATVCSEGHTRTYPFRPE